VDNGHEFARPTELEKKLDLPIYFAPPYPAWERGTNENANGLLRPYVPKGTDLSQVTDAPRRSPVRQINHRPRKCLGLQTAFEVFHPRPPGELVRPTPFRETLAAPAGGSGAAGKQPERRAGPGTVGAVVAI